MSGRDYSRARFAHDRKPLVNVVGFKLLASKTSPYPFTPEELSRNNREGRLRRIGITPYPLKDEGARINRS